MQRAAHPESKILSGSFVLLDAIVFPKVFETILTLRNNLSLLFERSLKVKVPWIYRTSSETENTEKFDITGYYWQIQLCKGTWDTLFCIIKSGNVYIF